MAGRDLKVAILGFGTVGSSVARILGDLKPQSFALTHVYNRKVARKRVDWFWNVKDCEYRNWAAGFGDYPSHRQTASCNVS